jgi:uncharacterized protein YoxC
MTGVSVSDLSLALIALAVAIAAVALVPVLVQLRRTAARAEVLLTSVEGALPGLLADLEELVERLNRTTDTIGNLAAAVDGVFERVGHATRDVVVPSLANIVGLVSALREGLEWALPRRDRRRDGA